MEPNNRYGELGKWCRNISNWREDIHLPSCIAKDYWHLHHPIWVDYNREMTIKKRNLT